MVMIKGFFEACRDKIAIYKIHNYADKNKYQIFTY